MFQNEQIFLQIIPIDDLNIEQAPVTVISKCLKNKYLRMKIHRKLCMPQRNIKNSSV